MKRETSTVWLERKEYNQNYKDRGKDHFCDTPFDVLYRIQET